MHKLLLIFLIFLTSCVDHQRISQEESDRLLQLPYNHFVNTISVKNEQLDTYIRLDTSKAYQEGRGLLKIVWDDIYAISLIDRETQKVDYLIYAALKHRHHQWLFPTRANYGNPLKTAPMVKKQTDVDCTASQIDGCTYWEHYFFKLDPEEINNIMNSNNSKWQFRIKTKSGIDKDFYFNTLELKALIQKTKSYL